MSRAVKSFAPIAAIGLFTIGAVAQAPSDPKQAARKETATEKTKELSTQIEFIADSTVGYWYAEAPLERAGTNATRPRPSPAVIGPVLFSIRQR